MNLKVKDVFGEDVSGYMVLSLKLSDKSKKQIVKMKAVGTKCFMIIFDCLSDKEVAQYATLNKKISDNILNKRY